MFFFVKKFNDYFPPPLRELFPPERLLVDVPPERTFVPPLLFIVPELLLVVLGFEIVCDELLRLGAPLIVELELFLG